MGNGIQLPATQAGNFEDPDAQAVRARPSGLETLSKTTNFSKKELKILYRGFKQACPTGMVNEEKFKEVFAQFFPQGDANAYAHYVFRVFDMDQSGAISFEEFVTGISVLLRGSLREKLLWTFTLYDTNGDGVITKDELMDIVTSVYDLMGSFTEPRIKESTARDHVEMVFQFLNSSGNGVLTEDEFLEQCEQNESIVSSMTVFDTVV